MEPVLVTSSGGLVGYGVAERLWQAGAWNEGHLGPLLIDAAARDLGYVPHVDLRAGLATLVDSLKQPETRLTGEKG